jgi:hypothetical protein
LGDLQELNLGAFEALAVFFLARRLLRHSKVEPASGELADSN